VLGGLEQEIARIIAQLAAPDRRLVGYAALLGVDVSVHEVARVAETAPSVATVALARAVALGIMVESARESGCVLSTNRSAMPPWRPWRC